MSVLVICILVVLGICVSASGNMSAEQNTALQSSEVSAKIKTPFIITFVHSTPNLFGEIEGVLFINSDVIVAEETASFCLVESDNGTKGYVFKGWVNIKKFYFNRNYDHVYVGTSNTNSSGNPRAYLKYNGNGKVGYYTFDTDIISVDSETGLVTAKKTGTATLYARVGMKTASIPIYCIYEWKKPWTGETNKSTDIYVGPSSLTTKVITIPNDWNFYVKGDDGTDDGWAYGYANYKGEQRWGFVKINNISTKGTISQYNKMGWNYPIQDTKFKNISSVYGWRNGSRHLGFDINKGNYSSILGEELVAPFRGKVVFSNKDYNYSTEKPNYGYCIILESEEADPVSGNKLHVVFMHLNEAPTLNPGNAVIAGQTIGKIGTTGNSTGPHLHLEINNKGTNFAGVGNPDSFDKTINPIFFYLNSGLNDNSTSTYNEYWYNENK